MFGACAGRDVCILGSGPQLYTGRKPGAFDWLIAMDAEDDRCWRRGSPETLRKAKRKTESLEDSVVQLLLEDTSLLASGTSWLIRRRE